MGCRSWPCCRHRHRIIQACRKPASVLLYNCFVLRTQNYFAFLPDGSLCVSTGDGASYNRVDVRAFRTMDVNSLAGKVLRIDPITGKSLPDNPYYSLTNDPDANSAKVYQMGIRNSFRMTVNKDNSGQFFLGEFGWFS